MTLAIGARILVAFSLVISTHLVLNRSACASDWVQADEEIKKYRQSGNPFLKAGSFPNQLKFILMANIRYDSFLSHQSQARGTTTCCRWRIEIGLDKKTQHIA